MQNLLNDNLKTALQADARCIIDGELNKAKIEELALEMDSGLLKLLLTDPALKKHFFTQVDDIQIFDKIKFQRFINNKSFLPDSYTAYKNKIGLTDDNGNFISESKEVVLSWPHKDCVLEGGQDKEDAKRDEIFFNEILAPDQIDHLLEPKALTNFKKYDANGEHDVSGITYDDNLLIKGNNLLALHSLEKVYAGKVKLIYIDPPYNTGNDSFGYNDRFNHSAWLTFMSNRLEVAKNLLEKSGVIWVHCDNNEQAELKILLDEKFGSHNFIDTISVVNNPRGRDYGGIANMHEFIHLYAKNIEFTNLNKIEDKDKEFPHDDDQGGFELRELRNRNTAFNDKNRPNLVYPFYVDDSKQDKNGLYDIYLNNPENNLIEVYPAKSQGIQTVWRWGKEKSERHLNKDIKAKAMKDGRFQIVEKYRDKTRMLRSVWWDKDVNSEKGTLHLKEIMGGKVFAHPKPETLMERIIEASTNSGDIVLDYHLGSGTTASTALKMGRRFIGCEQMDYINTVTTERLKKVVDGENGGISNKLNWQGGGSFIYCELAKCNQNFIDKIMDAKDDKALTGLLGSIKDKGFISYKVDKDKFDGFESLSFDDKKKFLIELLDKNMLYVNLSEIEDKDHGISDKDIQLNRLFYSLEKQQAFAE